MAILAPASAAFAETGDQPSQTSGSAVDAGPHAMVEEIVVTARRREESIQRVPQTISVVPPSSLTDRGGNIAALTQIVTGLSQNAFSDRNNISFAIRGQQQTYQTLVSPVLTYFAEVPVMRVSDGQSFDLGNVQVLKGPQGTLFGRVTDGGAILFTPVKPTNEFEGYLEAKFGNHAQRQVAGAVNIPIVSDKVLLRVAFDVNRRDGYTYNQLTQKDLDDVAYEAGRVSLVLRPTPEFENYTIVNYNHAETNGTGTVLLGINPAALTAAGLDFFTPGLQAELAAQGLRGPRQTNIGSLDPLVNGGTPNGGIYYKREVLWLVNTTRWTLSDNMELKNIFGYVHNREHSGDDFDGTPINFLQEVNSNFPDPTYGGYFRTISDELQLQGTAFGDKLTYTIGAYADSWKVPGTNELLIVLFEGFQNSMVLHPETKSRAVYGQIGYDLSALVPGLKFDAGLRYTSDKNTTRGATYFAPTLDPAAVPHGQCLTDTSAYPLVFALNLCEPISQKAQVVTYTFDVTYEIDDSNMVYASVKRGYRQGGVNAAAQAFGTNTIYRPEFNLSYEAGFKSVWRAGPVQGRTNFSAFYDKYKDIQSYVTVTDMGIGYSPILNAAAATIKGIELDTEVIPFPGLTLTGSWSYTQAAYARDTLTSAELAAACPNDPLTEFPDRSLVCPLNPLPQTPKNTVRFAARYDIPLGDGGTISLGGDVYHTSSRYVNDAYVPGGTIPGYTLMNADISFNNMFGKNVDLQLFVHNLTDKVYLASIDSLLSAGNLGISKGFYGEPRMYGVKMRWSFGQ